MSNRWRRRRSSLAHCAVSLVLVAAGLCVSSSRASALAPGQPPGCPVVVQGPNGPQYFANEQYPPAGLPRGSAPVPYELPFAGQMTNGVLKVGTGDTAVIGPADANICGVFALPSQIGTSTTTQLQITDNPVPVNLAVEGVEVFVVYIELTANVTARLLPAPAANGGLNLQLQASFAGTLVPQPGAAGLLSIPVNVPGFNCTTTVGPITFTTQTSGKLTGKPITGPISDAQSTLVANDFVYPALQSSTPPVTTNPAPPAGSSCTPTAASTLSGLLGLPQPAGNATFTANANFAVHVTA